MPCLQVPKTPGSSQNRGEFPELPSDSIQGGVGQGRLPTAVPLMRTFAFMPFLHNRVSRRELKARMRADNTPRTTVSFYLYTRIEDPVAFRDRWYGALKPLGVLGRIYVAGEGVNAQASLPGDRFDDFRSFLDAEPGFHGLRLNTAVDNQGSSFFVLTIKVRDRIVADGILDPGFDMQRKGAYVDAAAFNRLTEDPDTLVVDMRNHYEYEVGHFQNAIEIPSETFREQLPMAVEMLGDRKDRNIIMYCTGGIRCEKASAWMLHNGFTKVHHLEGGIIHYVRQVRELGLENRFIGKNFVFDERMGERITDDVLACCHVCGNPNDNHVNCANPACHLLFIQCPDCATTLEGCCSAACRDMLHKPVGGRKPSGKHRRRMNIFNSDREPPLREKGGA